MRFDNSLGADVDEQFGAFGDGVVELWIVRLGVFSGILLFCRFYGDC